MQAIHKTLEAKIAAFHGMEDAILYASCFDANAGLFEVLLGENDAVFSDQLNHASIIDGVRLAKTRKFRYKHKGVCMLCGRCVDILVWVWLLWLGGDHVTMRDSQTCRDWRLCSRKQKTLPSS